MRKQILSISITKTGDLLVVMNTNNIKQIAANINSSLKTKLFRSHNTYCAFKHIMSITLYLQTNKYLVFILCILSFKYSLI